MTGTVLLSRPGPDIVFRLVRHEGRTVANKDQIPTTCRVHVGHARQVPDGRLDWGVRGARSGPTPSALCFRAGTPERPRHGPISDPRVAKHDWGYAL